MQSLAFQSRMAARQPGPIAIGGGTSTGHAYTPYFLEAGYAAFYSWATQSLETIRTHVCELSYPFLVYTLTELLISDEGAPLGAGRASAKAAAQLLESYRSAFSADHAAELAALALFISKRLTLVADAPGVAIAAPRLSRDARIRALLGTAAPDAKGGASVLRASASQPYGTPRTAADMGSAAGMDGDVLARFFLPTTRYHVTLPPLAMQLTIEFLSRTDSLFLLATLNERFSVTVAPRLPHHISSGGGGGGPSVPRVDLLPLFANSARAAESEASLEYPLGVPTSGVLPLPVSAVIASSVRTGDRLAAGAAIYRKGGAAFEATLPGGSAPSSVAAATSTFLQNPVRWGVLRGLAGRADPPSSSVAGYVGAVSADRIPYPDYLASAFGRTLASAAFATQQQRQRRHLGPAASGVTAPPPLAGAKRSAASLLIDSGVGGASGSGLLPGVVSSLISSDSQGKGGPNTPLCLLRDVCVSAAQPLEQHQPQQQQQQQQRVAVGHALTSSTSSSLTPGANSPPTTPVQCCALATFSHPQPLLVNGHAPGSTAVVSRVVAVGYADGTLQVFVSATAIAAAGASGLVNDAGRGAGDSSAAANATIGTSSSNSSSGDMAIDGASLPHFSSSSSGSSSSSSTSTSIPVPLVLTTPSSDGGGGVFGVALSACGQFVLTASFDGSARLYSTIAHVMSGVRAAAARSSAAPAALVAPSSGAALTGNGVCNSSSQITAGSLSPAAAAAAPSATTTDGGTAASIALAEGAAVELIYPITVYTHSPGVPAWCCAFNPVHPGVFMTGGRDGTAKIWTSAVSSSPNVILAGHVSDVSVVGWHANGLYAITGSTDGSVRIWDAASGDALRMLLQPVASLGGAASLGGFGVGGGGDGGEWSHTLGLSSASSFNVLGGTPGDDGAYTRRDGGTGSSRWGAVTVVCPHPSGRWVATATEAGVVVLWDIPCGAPAAVFLAPAPSSTAGSGGHTLLLLPGEGTAVHSATNAPVAGTISRSSVGNFDLPQTAPIYALSWSEDGSVLGIADAEGAVSLWDTNAVLAR